MSSTNPFDRPASTPPLSFSTKDEYGRTIPKPIGTRLGGIVKKGPEFVQSRFYEGSDKGKPMFWCSDSKGKAVTNATTPDGRSNNPVQQIVIVVTCPDGEDRSFWVSLYPKAMFEAIQAATTLPDGSMRAIEPGDNLFITLSGLTPQPGKNPSYDYTAEFTKGAGVFAAPPAPPAAAPAPPAPPASVPTTPEGHTLAGLIAAGWTAEQAVQTYPMLGVPTAPVAAPAPPAPPAAPAVSPEDVAAKVAALSDADKALLGL